MEERPPIQLKGKSEKVRLYAPCDSHLRSTEVAGSAASD
jgi:hypothetical protein